MLWPERRRSQTGASNRKGLALHQPRWGLKVAGARSCLVAAGRNCRRDLDRFAGPADEAFDGEEFW
jgi:hypothetical protein